MMIRWNSTLELPGPSLFVVAAYGVKLIVKTFERPAKATSGSVSAGRPPTSAAPVTKRAAGEQR